ncbi:MAG: DUF3466 family protein [Planctomycetes bacterium]|nr:DUF3466 family protein [Planctomycetota bacterium]
MMHHTWNRDRRTSLGLASGAIAVAAFTLLGIARPAMAEGTDDDVLYRVRDLGTVDGYGHTAGLRISDAGEIVGALYRSPWQEPHAFRWYAGEMTAVGEFGDADLVEARGVNRHGDLVGWWDLEGEHIRAFMQSRDGVLSELPLPDGHFASIAFDINDSGQIAGYSQDERGYPHALLIDGDEAIDLGNLGGYYSMSYGISDAGYVVGKSDNRDREEHAFVWFDGKMYDLGTLGGDYSEARCINDTGQVTGTSTTRSGFSRAFFYENGEMTEIGTLGGLSSYGMDINSQGIAVGYTYDREGKQCGFIYTKDSGIRNLNDLLETPRGWSILQARSINELGQIAAVAERFDGLLRAVVLSPPGMKLTQPSPGIAGEKNWFGVERASSKSTVQLYYSYEPGTHKVIGCSNLTFSIADPILLATSGTSKWGDSEFLVHIPEKEAGNTIFFQCFDAEGCRLSPVVVHTFD